MITERYNQALKLALKLHEKQMRKGTNIPYISHLESVAAIVWKNDGSETEAIAALLHDAVEDQGGLPTLQLISDTFGTEVANIVAACSDTINSPTQDWHSRKLHYINALPGHSKSALLVSAADKLDNIRDILFGYTHQGEDFWKRFNGTRDQILWYYKSVCEIFIQKGPQALGQEILKYVMSLEQQILKNLNK